MARFHLQPTSGEPGVCKAKRRCPFGDLETEHYGSALEAREAFEKAQAATIAGPLMSHTPRANWVEADEDLENRVYSNYRGAMRRRNKVSRRNGSGYPSEARQQALKVTADRYKMPVSQVKSIVQQLKELEGNDRASDPQHQRRVAHLLAVKKEWDQVTFDENGDAMVCRCGSKENVEMRYDPFAAEIHGEHKPWVCCQECFDRQAEEI